MRYNAIQDCKPGHWRGRPLLSLPQNGKVALDNTLFLLWQIAQGRTQAEINQIFKTKGSSDLTIAAGLACLTEAGLLAREGQRKEDPGATNLIQLPQDPPLISAIIISFNGMKCLGSCLDSLITQSYPSVEIIVVDNKSSDGSADWIRKNYPKVRVLETNHQVSFACALNNGFSAARGEYWLALNQDVRLERDCIEEMFQAIQSPDVAAVAACLRLMWAPAFLNGIGNQVRSFGWGTDNFIGHLDLGQFDRWQDVPSVCFAAALIAKHAWARIGPLDVGFPMYYEDCEWSYRSRMIGYRTIAAPRAIVYHAFGESQPGAISTMSIKKLENVVYGRLRFTAKLCRGRLRITRLISCAIQDLIGILVSFLSLRPQKCKAYLSGWKKLILDPPTIFPAKPDQVNNAFSRSTEYSLPHIWKGLPELTWELVCCEYLPLMLSRQTRVINELAELDVSGRKGISFSFLDRIMMIWQGGGSLAVLRRLWQLFRWQLG